MYLYVNKRHYFQFNWYNLQLSSIPEVNAETDTAKPQDPITEQTTDINETNSEQINAADESIPESSNTAEKIKPEYERFVKMVQVGVPIDAVKLKISLEGLDPNELDRILKK